MTRDQFLTEKMGECWHEWHLTLSTYGGIVAPYQCIKCGQEEWVTEKPEIYIDFSTWEGFGKLWEWAKEQEWWMKFVNWTMYIDNGHNGESEWTKRDYTTRWSFIINGIHPDRFADAVSRYLGWEVSNLISCNDTLLDENIRH